IVLGAVYMLWMFRRVSFGPLDKPENQRLKDVGAREIAILIPILALIVLMGIYPRPFLERMKPSVELVLQTIEDRKSKMEDGNSRSPIPDLQTVPSEQP
ncbi:MAG: Fe-S-binding domain-containing protein, partial [Candidatus Binatia bacterium]